MRYRHTILYWLKGLAQQRVEMDKEIVLNLEINFRVILTSNPDLYCLESDRDLAITGVLLDGMFIGAKTGTFEERLADEIRERRESRKQKFGAGLYLICLIDGTTVDILDTTYSREDDDFVICIDGASKEPIRSASEPHLLAALSALTLSADSILAINRVSDSVVFFRDDGKTIHSVNPFVNPVTDFISRPITSETVKSMEDWYQVFIDNQDFERVKRLLVSSLQTEGDKLRSFISAWTALEIFINKVFSLYENHFFQQISSGNFPQVAPQFLERIREVVKENYPSKKSDFPTVLRQHSKDIRSHMQGNKYGLSNKFALAASFLSPENAEEDIKAFMIAKKQRDNLSHGQDVAEETLPVGEVQNLTRKYLKLHLTA